MAKRLVEHITAQYVAASQSLNSKTSRHKIIAYVEGYDDILFWRTLLSQFENEKYYFEVMLPSRTSLARGKKCALMNNLGQGLGLNLIACVDADYDYLMQQSTDVSRMLCRNPFVFHTYTYAIENYQCYAPSLHNVCVMATLNDHALFDFEKFMADYSRIIYPLFIWSIWCYRNHYGNQFSMLHLCQVIAMGDFDLHHPEYELRRIAHNVNVKIASLQRQFPQAKGRYQVLREELQQLGLVPEETYLYVRGHDIFEKVVSPILEDVCEALRREREREIRNLALHDTQCTNELSGYQHASASPVEMLRKHTSYYNCKLYQRIQNDIRSFLEHIDEPRANAPLLSSEPYHPKERSHGQGSQTWRSSKS